ncbi:hypothetical protein CO695_07155 [Providencia alcalifaciens]|nr:hypothetical protein [Providencia alcalifaciens]ATG16079.1 hypothetical protein CO695_07155 [Providencia alcalifaciens]SQI41197.1 Uncharacterised protein [Providencia alcalifaciens]
MNVESIEMEVLSRNMKKDLFYCFDWNIFDVHYTVVDVDNKKIYALSSDYEWQLTYWHEDMDLKLDERLHAGIQYWENYSDSYRKILSKLNFKNKKIDFCSRYNNVFEILSINSFDTVPSLDLLSLCKWRTVMASYAYEKWNAHEYTSIPIRQEINIIKNENSLKGMKEISDYIRFGNLSFSNKEILTIKLLLSHRSIKEISQIQGCTEATENLRVEKIKWKLKYEGEVNNKFFNAMEEHCITLNSLGGIEL